MKEMIKSPHKVEKTTILPIKKTFDFYKTLGNLWNSKYLASPKITRYYHEPNEAYLSGSSSPLNLSIEESKQNYSTYQQKASFNIKQSKLRRKQIQLQREYVRFNQIEHASKQKESSSDFTGISLKKVPSDLPINLNSWEKLNLIPINRLHSFIPQKIIEKDLQAVETIINKVEKSIKENESLEDQRQGKRIQERLINIKRHNFYQKLEQKAGIDKIREHSVNSGIFGNARMYNVSERTKQ